MICPKCKSRFERRKPIQIYCSKICSRRAAKQRWNKKGFKIWRENNPWHTSYRHAKERCESISHSYHKKGIKFKMTIEDFKELWFRDKAHNFKQPTIDRIEGKLGYVKSNCRFIEHVSNCKRKKGNYVQG